MLWFLSPIDLRRAVLGHLIRAERPVAIDDLVRAVAPEFGAMASCKRISDLLRYQARLGHVRRMRRGVYEFVPGSLSKSTAWRCLNWRRERERMQHRPDVPWASQVHVVPNPPDPAATAATPSTGW
jgi:hypothetical protein